MVFISILFSCEKDEEHNSQAKDDTINAVEEAILDETMVLDNLIIENGTKKSGAPVPDSNSLEFDVSKSSTTAFMKNGFKINLPSMDSFSGLYLQIKQKEGGIADGFWDISFEGLETEDEDLIDVNFSDAIKPGKFCYVICVYDSEGNISQPQEVCIEIENWAGNSNLVGSWKEYSDEEIVIGESNVKSLFTDKTCFTNNGWCSETNESIYNDDCRTGLSNELLLKADGTFTYEARFQDEVLNETSTNSTCEKVVYKGESILEGSGNWAYDEDKDRLFIVVFKEFSEHVNPKENYNNILKNGALGFEASIQEDYTGFRTEQNETDYEYHVYFVKN
ncbi:MAG: hypothetical protein COB98_03235 [Flavobacteriaceae bacterium]|nr:MAG: hypothetical protein COB98_03235 [Flavobacteriaceae bacterium]